MSGRITEIGGGLYHIYESLGVFCTLIIGDENALLIDTGFGFGELPALVRKVTALPLKVINTHGHIDHMMGNRYFGGAMIHEEDVPLMKQHSSLRTKTLIYLASRKNLSGKERKHRANFFRKSRTPVSLIRDGDVISLGQRDVEIIHTPGHTRGGICLLDSKTGILVSGDSFSSHVWLFLKESAPLPVYRNSIEKVLRRQNEIQGILSSHSLALFRPTLLEKIRRTAENLTVEKSRPFDSGFAGKALMYVEGFEEVTRRFGYRTFEEMMSHIEKIPPEAIAEMEFTSLVFRREKLKEDNFPRSLRQYVFVIFAFFVEAVRILTISSASLISPSRG